MRIFRKSLFVLQVLLQTLEQISKKLILRAKYLLLFLLVFLESMLLIAEDEKKSIVLEYSLLNFEEAYFDAVDQLMVEHEKLSGEMLVPGSANRVALKVNTRAGQGLSTPLNLVRAMIESLESRGFERHSILIVDFSRFNLKNAGFYEEDKDGAFYFEDCPVLALDSLQYFEPDWYYDSPIPPLLKDRPFNQGYGFSFLDNEETSSFRKSFLPIPLLFEVDFWINLAVGVEDPALGIDGALANASLWNVSNHLRFLANQSTAAVATAEILGIPEFNQHLKLHVVALEEFQFIGGPFYNSLYSRVQPKLWMSSDPVALDCLLVDLMNQERRENGFNELPTPNLQLSYASEIGLGEDSIESIVIKNINDPH
jgi:hypothetical protein